MSVEKSLLIPKAKDSSNINEDRDSTNLGSKNDGKSLEAGPSEESTQKGSTSHNSVSGNARKESVNTVAQALAKDSKFDEKEAVKDGVVDGPVHDVKSAASKVDTEPKMIDKSTLQEIIESFTALNFISYGSREVEVIGAGELVKLLLGADEFIFGETDQVESFFKVWFDEPNRQFYILRDESHFLKWSSLSEYFQVHLELLSKRMIKSLNVLREPERIYIDAVRVCNPEKLGYPSRQLLDGTSSDRVFRDALRRSCKKEQVKKNT